MTPADALRLAFPRHKPQFYGASFADLAIVSRYYSFGKVRSPIVLRALPVALRTPLARRGLVSRTGFTLPHDRRLWEDNITAIRDHVEVGSVVAYRSQWSTSKYGMMIISTAGRVMAYAEVRFQAEMYPLPMNTRKSFRVPALITERSDDGWTLRLFESLPPYHQPLRPGDGELASIADAVSESLKSVLGVDSATPQDWVRAHGDLTPWNLRRDSDGNTWLIDWEGAMWAPPLADQLRHTVTQAAADRLDVSEIREIVRSALSPPDEITNAARFWLKHQYYRDADISDDATADNTTPQSEPDTDLVVLRQLASRSLS